MQKKYQSLSKMTPGLLITITGGILIIVGWFLPWGGICCGKTCTFYSPGEGSDNFLLVPLIISIILISIFIFLKKPIFSLSISIPVFIFLFLYGNIRGLVTCPVTYVVGIGFFFGILGALFEIIGSSYECIKYYR